MTTRSKQYCFADIEKKTHSTRRSRFREAASLLAILQNKSGADEAIFLAHEKDGNESLVRIQPVIRQRGTVMWALISLFYREYCRARLAEMRKYRRANTSLWMMSGSRQCNSKARTLSTR